MMLVDESADRVLSLVQGLDARSRRLTTVALVLLVAGVGVALAFAKDRPPAGLGYGVPATFFVLSAVLLVLAAIGRTRDGEGPTVPVPGGEQLLGCWLGRGRVVCGLLGVAAQGDGIPDERAVSVLVDRRTTRLPVAARGSHALYDELAALVLDVLTTAQSQVDLTRVSAIGVGTPGVVDLATGHLVLSVTVKDADVPFELAKRLLAGGRACVEKAFDVHPLSEGELEQRIFVDNDVRCVARYELSKHVSWRSFACVYVGSGFGSALVFNGNVLFGQHGSAGHIGHVGLGPSSSALPLRTGHVLPAIRCDCGDSGFHLDGVASFNGLRAIAEAVAVDGFADVLPALRARATDAGQAERAFVEETFPRLVGAARGAGRERIPDVVRPSLDDPNVVAYLEAVLRAYVGVLAAGLGMLVNVGDFGRIVLCGPLVEVLRANESFDQTLVEFLPGHVLGGHMPTRTSAVVDEELWRGAALVAWDPTYHRQRAEALAR
jgi:predicted NBD/HSP70 family sugar kinase